MTINLTFSVPNRYSIISTLHLRPFLLYCCTRLEANKNFCWVINLKREKEKIYRLFSVSSVNLDFTIDLIMFIISKEREINRDKSLQCRFFSQSNEETLGMY